MSHKLSLLSLIACTLLIGACSHYDMPAAADLDQRLETQLTNNGIKQFSFTIERIRAPGMEGRHSRASFANGRKKYKNPAQRNRDLKDFAQTLLAISSTRNCSVSVITSRVASVMKVPAQIVIS